MTIDHSFETRQMIETIQKKVSDKTLSFGCIITIWNYMIPSGRKYEVGCYMVDDEHFINRTQIVPIKGNMVTNYGHPVMIGDMLDYIDQQALSNEDKTTYHQTILHSWTLKRKSIEYQSKEAIETIYNLIQRTGDNE